jgi:hypothetical protein
MQGKFKAFGRGLQFTSGVAQEIDLAGRSGLFLDS